MSDRIVYGVTTGEYDDYSTDVLFEDRADAQRHAAAINRRDHFAYANVREVVLLPAGATPSAQPTYHTRYDFPGQYGVATPSLSVWTDLGWDYQGEAPAAVIECRAAPHAVLGSGGDREALVKATRECWAAECKRRES